MPETLLVIEDETLLRAELDRHYRRQSWDVLTAKTLQEARKFLVDEEGTVSSVSVLDSSPEGVFEDSVLQTLPSWKFSPGRILGEPVSSWVVTTIRFELK